MRCRLIALLLTIMFVQMTGEIVMADQTPQTQEEIQREIDRVNKAKELAEARKALLTAEKALSDAQKTATPSEAELQQQLAAAKAAKDLAEAQKSVADARKAKSDADAAAFKAAVGEVPASGITGSVEVKDKTGELESALLSARAVSDAARTLDSAVRSALPNNSRIVALVGSDVPTFQNLIAYRTQLAIVQKALQDAIGRSQALTKKAGIGTEAAIPLVGAVGTVLDAANKLAGFFRTDYVVAGISVSIDDVMLLNEAANQLRTLSEEKQFTVTVPAIYNPRAVSGAGSTIVTDLTTLSLLKETAAALTRFHDEQNAKQTKDAESKQGGEKARIEQGAAEHKEAAASLRQAVALFDTWFGKLSTQDDKGSVPIVSIIKEQAIHEEIDNGHLLVLKIQKSGGGYLVKKNLWTFFGGIPVHYMGGAAISFTLVDGKTGAVGAAGVLPVYGGFVRARKVQELLASSLPARATASGGATTHTSGTR